MTIIYRSNRQRSTILLLLIAWLCLLQKHRCVAADDDYDFVQEILDEHEEHYDDDDPFIDEKSDDKSFKQTYEEEMKKKQEEEELRRKAQEERLEQERNDRIQRDREEAFEAELAKMEKSKQKAARKQKQIDAKIVKKVLKAAHNEDHYAVIGLRNLEFSIPQRVLKIPVVNTYIRIPGITLFHITPKAIKRAYRDMAKTTHPDKNRDGRANQAFVAVENSASILLDERQRQEYDAFVREKRRNRNEAILGRIAETVHDSTRKVAKSVRVSRKVLGPFAFPVTLLAILII